MKKAMTLIGLLTLFILAQPLKAQQGLNAFKLPNGMTVYIWEDDSQPDVFGMVGVNVGAYNDPEDLTGLAHYLEHVMFKGTQKIGTTDWEKEKPIYEQIIAKYDEMAATEDLLQKESISKEINKLTIEASTYAVTNEFQALTEEIGGKRLNAGTIWDKTVYYNSFPPSQIFKWLELNSERFINPVFRAFQPELETVYEEFNMTQDDQSRQMSETLLKNLFPGQPYARPVIGLQEHLKNPKLSGLIDFYNKWYVPENMVLVLVGNIKTNQVLPLIKAKFGRLEARKSPERKKYPAMEFKGRKEMTAKLSPYPQVFLAFNGVKSGHPDEMVLNICTSLLSNGSRTGLLDKLSIDGDVMNASADLLNFKEQGRIILNAVPYYDVNQRRFSSLKAAEKLLLKEVEKLQKGAIEEWLLNAVKGNLIRNFDLAFESSETRANILVNAFVNNEDLDDIIHYKEKIAAVTLDQVKATAKKYFTNDYLVLQLQQGKPEKAKKLKKPHYDPITPSRTEKSEYAQTFATLPVRKDPDVFCNFNDVQIKKVNDRSKVYYTQNKQNEVFSLILKYGVGTHRMPKLRYAVQLMNNAGIMGQYEPQDVKREFSHLNASCRFGVDENYLYVVMEGYEHTLAEACNLLTRQILMPKLDEKQLNSIVGSTIQQRLMENDNVDVTKNALHQYMLYDSKSAYIDRMSIDDLISLTISNLTGEFSRATDYEAEIHYAGSLPFEDAYEILSKNLPLKAQEKQTTSPEVKGKKQYTENTILFLPESDALQSAIFFYIDGKPFDIQDRVSCNAFNQYIDGQFNGLIMQEIREFRSLAYTAYGEFVFPPLIGKNIAWTGYIGTQPDKTIDALDLYLKLLSDMPLYPERIHNIKQYLHLLANTNKPDFRSASETFEEWKRLGYTEDPAKSMIPVIDQLTFDDIVKFYEENVKGKTIVIGIVGDPKHIDTKVLEKYGKVVKVRKNKIFSSK